MSWKKDFFSDRDYFCYEVWVKKKSLIASNQKVEWSKGEISKAIGDVQLLGLRGSWAETQIRTEENQR